MTSLDILCSNHLKLKNKIMKIEHKKKKFVAHEKYFMAHQYMSTIFHDTHKYPLRSSYILTVRSLYKSLFTDEKKQKK